MSINIAETADCATVVGAVRLTEPANCMSSAVLDTAYTTQQSTVATHFTVPEGSDDSFERNYNIRVLSDRNFTKTTQSFLVYCYILVLSV